MTDQVKKESKEWLEALESLVEFNDKAYANVILEQLNQYAQKLGLSASSGGNTPYVNTIAEDAVALPDDLDQLEQLMPYLRWNAIAMVMRAGKFASELGGHIASYGSVAYLFEVGLNYFFRGRTDDFPGDLVYFQGHSSPGVYSRAYLEGRMDEKQLDAFRQEITNTPGLSSYPHPWLMPDFWQFPTVSMGLSPMMAIYQAHILTYLENRGLTDNKGRKVWAFCGDGEMGEPESLGLLNIAGREKLDNLIFVVNCNLQRLDGPVWAAGQIIQEFERVYRGAGWNVIKVMWGSGWDALFKKDQAGILLERMDQLNDGEFQNYNSKDGAYIREHFFNAPELKALVADMDDATLKKTLLNGGLDPKKVYAAYHAAVNHQGQPTVILAHTVKGYGMGDSGEGVNIAHNAKKMSADDLQAFGERFGLSLSREQIENLDFIKPNKKLLDYVKARRADLGGFIPERCAEAPTLPTPELSVFKAQLESSGERELSSTMAFVRILSILLRDPALKERVVPIMADESRTFGMEGLFRQIGVYSVYGQPYEPEDKNVLMYYREAKDGQLLQEGLSEAGAMSSWVATATSYASNGLPMIPFYVYYSMFGFQRVGDLVWAAADMRARGFIMGGTAGRTTLAGEGLQHQDGHNLLMFSMVPNCISYDPTFAYELAVIIREGIRRMFTEQEDVFYYITLMNENYTHPAMPEGAEDGIIKGMYRFRSAKKAQLQLMGSGAILREVIKAADLLEKEFNVSADIWSVTSFNELRKDMESVERHNRLQPEAEQKVSYVQQCMADVSVPVIAATDYIRLYADQIRTQINAPYYVLGTDGFGRSDTRVALRDFFEVDAKMIAYTALKALCDQGDFSQADLLKARQQLAIATDRPDPMTV